MIPVFSRLAGLFREPSGRPNITRLMRNPPQLRVIARHLAGRDRLRVLVHGMADGAEPVSLLMALDPAGRSVDLRIEGRDVSAPYVEDAKAFTYSRQHEPSNLDLRELHEYIQRVPLGGGWRVRRRWRDVFHYAAADVTQPSPDLPRGAFDLVACQNVFIHLPDEVRDTALGHLVAHAKPGGLLALGGGPLGTVHRLARRHGLVPIVEDAEAIHEAWEVQRSFWSNPRHPYWALEPFDPHHPEGPQRYCTLFRKPEGGA